MYGKGSLHLGAFNFDLIFLNLSYNFVRPYRFNYAVTLFWTVCGLEPPEGQR